MTTPRCIVRCLALSAACWISCGPSRAGTVILNEARLVAAGDTSLEGQDVVIDAARVTVAGPHTWASLLLRNGAVLDHESAAAGEATHAIRLTVLGAVTVDASSRIEATGLGYTQAGAPGAGGRGDYAGAGGGHGGRGFRSAGGAPGAGGAAFGSLTNPDSWGGPGGPGGNADLAPGGGLIHLEAGGVMTVDGGILADGSGARVNDQGGGAGGTVFLRAGTLRGAGLISAAGGNGEWIDGGGGAGGRIALRVSRNEFSGTIQAPGGGGAGVGGAGTIYTQVGADPGLLRIENAGRGEWTPLTAPLAFDVALQGNAIVYPTEPIVVRGLTVGGAALLTHDTTSTGLVVQASQNVVVESDAAINVDGRGYPRGDERGPGAGTQKDGWAGTGAAHGGWGGSSAAGGQGGDTYGSVLQPVDFGSQGGRGSGGPGTAGGGAIRLIVGGTLRIDGRLSAAGVGAPPNDSGGGSGGSLYLTVGTLAGSGTITVNGGPGEWIDGGGGGGGRIAVYYGANDFSGTLSAFGGGGAQRGGAGTIYLRKTTEAQGQLLVDNGGSWGNYTPLSSPEAYRVVLAHNAYVYPEAALTLQRLEVGPDCVFTHLIGQTNLAVHVLGDALVTGTISTDGRGYPVSTNRGLGTGGQVTWAGTGGGHGGLGGASAAGGPGGGHYDSILEPVMMGSQGGDAGGGPGTHGGGAIRLVVDGELKIDGRLSAEGAASPPNDSGGGSGGSIYLTVGALTGGGLISVNGGPGEWIDGGGGGGGRLAIYYGANTFAGTATAYGGGGSQRGGAGTIYTRKRGSAYGQLLIHNGGAWGNYTPLSSPEAFQVTLAEMAYVYPETPLAVRDLEIRTNTVLTHLTTQDRCELNVQDTLTIADGGSLTADGRGYPVGENRGPGAGEQSGWAGTGGGHGGTGGRSANGGAGGAVYGSLVEPLTAGSAGGFGSGGSGGAGGGVLRLIVGNLLRVQGRLSARGLNAGANDSGGGAGGSIFISAATLEGAGLITVDGGQGEWIDGGSGGGGRIALHLGTDHFSGSVTARGGPPGSQAGGSGTIYRRLGGETGGELVLENTDRPGALTPLAVPAKTRLVLGSGTAVYPPTRLEVESLRLKAGATLTHLTGQSNLFVHVAGDFTIDAGAVVTADAKGYPLAGSPGPGTGIRREWGGSGAGHGGNGGSSASGAPGGLGYGSILAPTELGSQGGSADGGQGTPGGGAIRLQVGGTLTIQGRVSADGGAQPPNNAGGGSGGSIWIEAGALAGQGVLTANGGPGEWIDGGGGGGGRIALYLGRNEFQGTLTARGNSGREAGGAGTIYEKQPDEFVGRVRVENGDVWGAYTPLFTEEAYQLTLANRAQGYADPAILIGSLDLQTNAVLTHLNSQDQLSVAVLGDAAIAGVINVDGRGYPIGDDPGPGAGSRLSWSGSGAGHGGSGGQSATGSAGGQAYGSRLEPSTRGSQGGAGDGGPGGAGGGVVRLLVGGTLTLDGTITANGLGARNNNSGGGSGGSVFVSTRAFAGAGQILAAGGAGEWIDGGGGAGGRIAVYRSSSSFTGTLNVTGAGGSAQGADGTLYQDNVPNLLWVGPAEGWIHDTVELQVAAFVGDATSMRCEFSVWQGDRQTPIATVPVALAAATSWDTAKVPDGSYELRAVLLDAGGRTLAHSTRAVSVNNTVDWRGGVLTESATWRADRVQLVNRDLDIPEGITLTLEPGAIVKFLPGVRVIVRGGGTLASQGTAAQPVTLTSFLDDSVGGDSNLDGNASRPTPGAWRLSLNASGTLALGDQTRLRYQAQSYGGLLAGSETWTGDSLREITETVVVPQGATLRIEAGAVLKFAADRGLDISAGATLTVAGTSTQPVVFTSLADDAYGGDSNQDGTRTRAAAGDWRSVRLADGASATLDHALIQYGGNSIGNPWGAGGVLEALGGPLTVRNCILADALKDGAFCYGTTRFENCLVLRCDRGLTAVGTMDVVNCTIDACRIGLLEHVGQLNVYNSIISRSIDVGIEHDLGGGSAVVRNCNVWNPGATRGNYNGLTDPTDRNGNLSAAPRYKDPDQDNFRLNYASPGIDAADGSRAPATDLAGAPRYDDPRTGNSGTPAANGGLPDIGAFEFVESAPSSIDLVVTQVLGPGEVVAGGLAHVDWVVANRGAEPFAGPWHDVLYLRNQATGEKLLVAEPLVGKGLTVGPGQTQRVGADIRVPGGVAATYEWTVVGNSRGDLFEGANADNNESQSGTSAALDVPPIPLDGAAVVSSFGAQEEVQWFRCVAPVGKDVRIDVDLAASTGITEVYVGRAFLPSPEHFTARQREFASPDTSAIASGSPETPTTETANTFYVVVVGRVLGELPASFRVKATSAAFAVESALPARVGNAGLVTLDVHGAGFATNTTLLVRHGAEVRRELRRSARESGRVHATFDLTGFPAGPADVVADTGGLTVARPGALTVVDGGTPDFFVELKGPGTTRAGRLTTWFVTYGNRGLVDQELPLLRFRTSGATELQIFESTLNWAPSFTFLGLVPDVLLPTLGPGQEHTLEVRVRTMTPIDVNVDVLTGEEWAFDTTPFQWASLPAPAGADPAHWAEKLASLPDRLGATVADYRAQLGREILELASSRLRYSYLACVNGHWLFGDEPSIAPEGRPLLHVPDDYVTPEPSVALQRPPVKVPGDGITNTYWVVLTIEDYSKVEGDKPKNLPGTAVDFEDLTDFIVKDLRIDKGHAFGGHDGPGRKQQINVPGFMFIMSQLLLMKQKVDADDNLVVVYSGHGGMKSDGSPYLALNGGYMDPKVFARLLDNVGAGTTYFVNDSCHSEAFNEKVKPSNTTFVGLAATAKDRVSFDTQSGGELISNLKSNLRKCNGLGKSFELTATEVTERYKERAQESERQHPVLTNPNNVDLSGKPWGESKVIGEELRDRLEKLRLKNWAGNSLKLVGSVDPNDKYALAGAGTAKWVQPTQILPFQIVFENKTNAAAPAQEVLVTDDLDARLDWSTFELKSIAFNDAKITVPPGLQRFSTTARVGSDPNEVTVEVGLNPATGRITWLLRSRDAATGDLPEDPFAGFLPPNDATRRGEGSLSYTVRSHPGLPDGTQITNRATIIFDPTYGANPPIVTPWVTNAVDATAPASAIAALPAEGIGEIPVTWSGNDAPGGSGIATYDIYASRDEAPYQPWLLATTETSARFLGEPGARYRFYSVARDAAGNVEGAPDQPDASITIGGGGTVGPVAIEWTGSDHVRVTFTGTLQSALSVSGPWLDVVGATSPYVISANNGSRFFRARK